MPEGAPKRGLSAPPGSGAQSPPGAASRAPDSSEETIVGPESTSRQAAGLPASLAQRYEVLSEIGRGGMGIVYRARDRETGEIVALKVLKPEICGDPAIVERFKNELRLARKITHKNACRIHELLRFDDTAVISMEFVEGESLRAFLTRYKSVSIRTGLEWTLQVCSALEEAHQQGVVHRDLKPENIMITREGAAKVMDFGIARSLETEATSTVGVVGTPAYMSPEQAEGKSADARADMYSLGLVLYEMFTGRPAIRGGTPLAAALKQIHDTPASPREVEPFLPAFLADAIEKCLEKRPDKRFQTIAELRAALSKTRAPAPSEGDAEPTPPAELLRWQRADIALLVLVVAGLAYFLAAHDKVLPASRMRLQVDALGARRVAEETAARLRRPLPELWNARLVPRTGGYRDALENWAIMADPRPVSDVWPKELAAWRVDFRSVYDEALSEVQAVPERYALVNSRARLERIHFSEASAQVPPAYRAPAAEERRAIAQRALETVCGSVPPQSQLREESGGETGAAYRATWQPRPNSGSGTAAQVSLLAEQVVDVDCSVLPGINPQDVGVKRVKGFVNGGLWLFRVWISLFLLVTFVVARCYRWRPLWRRLPLAVVVALAVGWQASFKGGGALFASAPGVFPGAAVFLLVLFVLAGAGLAWTALAAIEQQLWKWAPGLVASYARACRGRFIDPAVGIALFRGGLAGMVIAALGTLLAHGGLILGNTWWAGPASPVKLQRVIRSFAPAFLDPVGVTDALQTFSPAAFVLLFALASGLLVGFVSIGIQLVSAHKRAATRGAKLSQLALANQAGLLVIFLAGC
jgi:predicted Ser/Thr protein kinase